MKLSDFASNTYSQFGEDGMINHVFERIGIKHRTCVEFGASDGVSCSNTANLWRSGWQSVLIEGDPDVYHKLLGNVDESCKTINAYVGIGPCDIDVLLAGMLVDYMSIDVDGEDYVIFRNMITRPRVISIEYNQSIPPHINLRQLEDGDYLGASAGAIVDLAAHKGYGLVGLTKGNLIFVVNEEMEAFREYETSLLNLFDYDALCYLATDYAGHSFLLGSRPPWGLTSPPFLREVIGAEVIPNCLHKQELLEAWEAIYGPAFFIPANEPFNMGDGVDGGARKYFMKALRGNPDLIIVDVENIAGDGGDWMVSLVGTKYWTKRSGPYMVYVRANLRKP